MSERLPDDQVVVLIARKTCGCVTAVMVKNDENITKKDIRDFYREAADTDRSVETMPLLTFRAGKFGCDCEP